MTTTTSCIWIAASAPNGWQPWEAYQSPVSDLSGARTLTTSEAHRLARSLRKWGPFDLVAVRPADGSRPVAHV